ncbi:MAG TPA: homoserine kinase [Acidimicrobiales bacterium]|nr:homoserine kinase [Acidimicrobiales bacterium]
MRARCPCSSANLGPGFDALALALSLYVDVSVEPADALSITTHGEGEDFPASPDHMAARVARDVLGHDNVAITIRSDIPVARGLGSSAALAAATAAAAGAADPLAVATAVDGHAENAAASVLGGLVVGTMVGDTPVAERLAVDDRLAFVVVIPDRMLSTRDARAALHQEVPLHDAATNLGRLGLLIAGFADAARFSPYAMEDTLHQPYRIPLFPESASIMRGLIEAGALGACWSGAGSTLLAVAMDGDAEAVCAAGTDMLTETNVAGRALRLDVDRTGLVVTD